MNDPRTLNQFLAICLDYIKGLARAYPHNGFGNLRFVTCNPEGTKIKPLITSYRGNIPLETLILPYTLVGNKEDCTELAKMYLERNVN